MPLVLLHAFPVDSRMWRPQSSFDPITPEILGISSIDDVADHVARLLDQRAIERAVIGGLSRGGYIALAFARRHPDRLDRERVAEIPHVGPIVVHAGEVEGQGGDRTPPGAPKHHEKARQRRWLIGDYRLTWR